MYVCPLRAPCVTATGRPSSMIHTCHILPPSEIDSGLFLAVFAGSGGKYLVQRTG